MPEQRALGHHVNAAVRLLGSEGHITPHGAQMLREIVALHRDDRVDDLRDDVRHWLKSHHTHTPSEHCRTCEERVDGVMHIVELWLIHADLVYKEPEENT